jgi:hypothetical protein
MVKRGERKFGLRRLARLALHLSFGWIINICMPNRGSPPIAPRHCSCPQPAAADTIIAYPMRAYQLRAATKSPAVTRLDLFAFCAFSSTITSSPVCLPV